ncbi:hypothetical protein EMCRGX_G015426 [Ephydatia muelleri]
MLDISRLEHFPSPILLLLYTIMACHGVSAQRCPNATFTISCNITTPGPVTIWKVPPGYCPSNDITLLQSSGTNCGSENDSCGPFTASNLVPPSGMACTTSVLSVVAAPQLNGTNISCYSYEILQYQHVILITIPPGLPLVMVRPMGNGLVVSCTPGANGDPPTGYDITVEPNGTHIITPSNGMVEQNIPGLLPNTTYTVRVIAINCAGSSGVVAVNATTANIATQPPLPLLIPVGVGVGVGVPLILVIIAVVIMMLYKSYHPSTQWQHFVSFCNTSAILCSTLPNLVILGAPVGDYIHCSRLIAELCTQAKPLLQCLQEVTGIDLHGGLGLRSLSLHAFIASLISSGHGCLDNTCLQQAVTLYNAKVSPPDALTVESVLASPTTQKALSSKIDMNLLHGLLRNASPANKALLLSESASHAAAWLSVVPSIKLGLHLEPNEYPRWLSGGGWDWTHRGLQCALSARVLVWTLLVIIVSLADMEEM